MRSNRGRGKKKGRNRRAGGVGGRLTSILLDTSPRVDVLVWSEGRGRRKGGGRRRKFDGRRLREKTTLLCFSS